MTGTLANNDHRAYLVECKKPDWDAFLEPSLVMKDVPIEGAQRCVKKFQELGAKIVFLTGRREPLRATTKMWIHKHFKIFATKSNLFMRPEGNREVPTVFKSNILKKLAGEYKDYTIIAAEDDAYMQQTYFEFGIIPLQAPDCWKSIFSLNHNLPPEGYWRR